LIRLLRFDTASKRALRVVILPEVAQAVAQRAQNQGVSAETLVNALLIEQLHGLGARA
jgi:predicted HicB family RNase H-like nuclease